MLAWLESGFVPEGYSEKAMEQFEKKIERWLKDHERQHRGPAPVVTKRRR